jgi:tRNA threonylcarbamoyladenosine biosynthesis protein TsaB
MNKLIINTAETGFAFALSHANGTISSAHFHEQQGQGELLLETLDQFLKEKHTPLNTIEQYIAITGPGSFTGTRIGIATCEGFALTAKKPSFGISLFSALAFAAQQEKPSNEPLDVLIDAKREAFYHARLHPQTFAYLVTPQEIPQASWKNEVQGRIISNHLVAESEVYIPSTSATIAAAQFAMNYPLEALEPLYIRPPDAKPAKPSLFTHA